MARTKTRFFFALLTLPAAARAHGGGGFSVPENPKPMSAEERVEELKRTDEFLTKLHDLMHQIREAPNEAECVRLKAGELRLLNTRVAPHAGPAAPQEEVQRRIQQEAEPSKAPK